VRHQDKITMIKIQRAIRSCLEKAIPGIMIIRF